MSMEILGKPIQTFKPTQIEKMIKDFVFPRKSATVFKYIFL